MREMFRIAFASIASLFRAIDNGARTLENYAKWAEGESAAFEAEGQVERQARLVDLKLRLTLV